MNREVHVRIWERPEVRVLRATRHQERFPRPRLSARYWFSEGTFAGTRGNLLCLGLLGMLLAQLVGPPQSADSGAVKRERRQRGLMDPKQPLRQPRFPTPAYLTEQAFPRPTRFWAAPGIGSVANEAYRSIVQLKISRYGVRRQQD